MKGDSFSNAFIFRTKWRFWRDCTTSYPHTRWAFCHDDYDGPPDNRCGTAASLTEMRDEILAIEELNA